MAAVLNHLWQSTLFALIVGLVALALHRRSAGARHLLWMIASLKFLVPFALLQSIGERLRPPVQPALIPMPPEHLFTQEPQFIQEAARPFPAIEPGLAAHPIPVIDTASILLAVWAAGTASVLAIWAWRWLQMRHAVRTAEPLDLAWATPSRTSATLLEPVLVGIWRPVLLLPVSLPDHLDHAQVEAILAHEACHLRRRDNLTSAVHMLVEALFWFYPPVWWIGGRLLAERERACDEAVIQAGHDRETYARGLLETCRLYLHSPLHCAAGASGSNLQRRVEAIMTAPLSSPLKPAARALLGASLVLTLASPVAAGILSPADAAGDGQAVRLLPAPLVAYARQAAASAGMMRLEPVKGSQPVAVEVQAQPTTASLFAPIAVEPPPEVIAATSNPRPIELAEAHLPALSPIVGDVPSAAVQSDATVSGAEALRVNVAASVSPAELDRYVGYYQLTRYALLHIYRIGDGLHLAYARAEQDDVKLVPQGGTTFLAPEYTRPHGAKSEMRQPEARVTFKLDASGNATGLVLQVLGQTLAAQWIENNKADSIEVALRHRLSLQIESPGTRKFLERFLRSVEAGAPDYSEMAPRLAASEKRGQDVAKISSLGQLKRIFFVVVTNEGSDRYTAVFAHSRIDFLVPPLDADGKVSDLVLRQSIPIYLSSGAAREDGVGRVFSDDFLAPPPFPLDSK